MDTYKHTLSFHLLSPFFGLRLAHSLFGLLAKGLSQALFVPKTQLALVLLVVGNDAGVQVV